jgi:hypothetical protein
VRDLVRRGASVSTVLVPHASAADRARLEAIAALGRGVTLDALDGLPALVAAPPTDRPLIVDEPAPIVTRSGGPALDRVIARHVRTALAPDADLLASVGGDPLLALRPHGRGRVIAYASTLEAATGEALLASFVERTPPPWLPTVASGPDSLTLTLSHPDPDAPPPAAVMAIDPAGRAFDLPLAPRGLGVHEARLEPAAPGLHLFSVVSGDASRPSAGASRIAYVVPDAETAAYGLDRRFIDRAMTASATGSTRISMPPRRVRHWLPHAVAILAMLATFSRRTSMNC